MVTEQLPELVESQVRAISGLKIDKVTVWDNGTGSDGKNATANFLSGMVGALPPLHELTKNVAVRLPEFLGSMESGEPSESAPNGAAETESGTAPSSDG
jgi:flotillin